MSSAAAKIGSEELQVSREGDCLHLRFNRPSKKNALTSAMYREAAKALDSADRESGIRCVLLSGEGSDFCAGNDLSDFMGAEQETLFAPINAFLRALVRLRRPAIAAVEGYAVGIGATMLLHCDAVFAGEGAKFKFPFLDIGLCPEAGSTQLLPTRVGKLAAFELFALGATWDCPKALSHGLITQMTPTGLALAAANKATEHICNLPQHAVLSTMELLNRGIEPVEARIEAEVKRFAALLASKETQERLMQSLAKRK